MFAQTDRKSLLFFTSDETEVRAAVAASIIASCPPEGCRSYKPYEFQVTHNTKTTIRAKCLPHAFRIALDSEILNNP